MSFGSPTPVEVAVQGVSLQDDYAYAQKVRPQLAKLSFLRDLQFAQENNYPTLDINIDRDRAGQFGLTMARRGALRACPRLRLRASPIPTTGAIRTPATPSRFRWNCRRTRCRASTQVGGIPVMPAGGPKPLLDDIASLKTGHHAGRDRPL